MVCCAETCVFAQSLFDILVVPGPLPTLARFGLATKPGPTWRALHHFALLCSDFETVPLLVTVADRQSRETESVAVASAKVDS